MDEAPEITGVNDDTDEEPQYEYDTTYVDIGQYKQHDVQVYNKEYHNSHEQNNGNPNLQQYYNNDAPQAQDIYPIEE